MFKKLIVIALLLSPVSVFAQVASATRGGGLGLSVGVEYSNFRPDWGPTRLQGIAVFADADHLFLDKLGVEGEARWLDFNKPENETEDNYLIGPRYRLLRYHGLSVYGKFLLGGGFITYPQGLGSGSYFAYVPGASVQYRLNHRWSVRGDYEYQFWPSAPGIVFTFPQPSNGLTPSGFSGGVSYRIF